MRKSLVTVLASLVLAVSTFSATNPGCVGTGSEKSNHGEPDTDVDGDSDTKTDTTTNTGEICDEQNFVVELVPVKLLILLDMSGSMLFADKWTAARIALGNVLTDFAGLFQFGFDTYPDQFYSKSCTVDLPIWFDTGLGNEPGIIEWLNANEVISGTGDPLVREMDILIGSPGYAPNFTAPGGDPHLVIVADGDDCCGPDAYYDCDISYVEELVERTLALLDMGIKTFVIGYGENADPAALGAIAANGGTVFTNYLDALDQTALEGALNQIAGVIASCTFELDEPDASADPEMVNLYFDDTVLPFDEGCLDGSGWDWTDATHTGIKLCKESCDQLQTGTVTNVSATWGCPSVTVE